MPIDRKSKCKNGTFIQPVASLKTLIKTNNLTDIWRKYNQDKQQFSWRRKDKIQASRIDMIFIGTDFCSLVETCKIKPVTIQSTNHQSVLYKFYTRGFRKG
jgi:exonuclease III